MTMTTLSRKLPTAARILLGLVFFVFGLNGFLQFLPAPPPPEAAAAFAGALFKTGYFFPMLKGIEVTAGVLLLSGRFVPLALALLAPIIVNIALFHVFLAPNPVIPVLLLSLEIFLAWSYREAFAPMLAMRVSPVGPGASDRPRARPADGEEVRV
jgi:uncharacterized membrane protein YphA (DoxX/SURF4 family)